jgi:hypothetical protein
MLVFESLSAGVIAVFITLVIVLVLVGIYTYFIWPFTYWNLSGVKIGSWWEDALGLIFFAGSTLGFWLFSGAAFKKTRARR